MRVNQVSILYVFLTVKKVSILQRLSTLLVIFTKDK